MRSDTRYFIKCFSPRLLAAAMLACLAVNPGARGANPAELLSHYSAQAKSTPTPAAGRQLFTSRHGREWSCASCHGATPMTAGSHASTGRPIRPLAPAGNPERFTDLAKTEKWFRRNCNDVLGRECTASEKANVLGWLLTFKP